MGGMQSRRRDSYSQTPYEYKTYIDEPMGRCSTINDIPAWTTPPAKIKKSRSCRPLKPTQKRPKYDPIYTIWKSAFEDKNIRCPRALLPIKEENAASQNITDAVAGQCTPNGFPSFTELRESMRRKKAVKHQDATDNYEVPNNSALTKLERTQNEKQIFADSVAAPPSSDEHETTEICFHTAFNFPNLNENLVSDDDDDENNQDQPCGPHPSN